MFTYAEMWEGYSGIEKFQDVQGLGYIRVHKCIVYGGIKEKNMETTVGFRFICVPQ